MIMQVINRMFASGLALLLLAGSWGCREKPDDLEQLAEWMSGSFSSAEQAALDTNFYDIRLQMVRIWPERDDGVWLYVEQASAENLERPYRQRVYRLSREEDGSLRSAVYTFENPLRFAGAWKMADPLRALSPDSLSERVGCHILLKRKDAHTFIGSTTNRDCPSDLRGASYATSEVTITSTQMISWDRGFDAGGNQVWGSEKGGYVFRKLQ